MKNKKSNVTKNLKIYMYKKRSITTKILVYK